MSSEVTPGIVKQLQERSLVSQTSSEELEAYLSSGCRTLYCGFDPTADSLHIGSLVPLLALKRFQMAGHRPIALAGGATGMIGDPSFKSKERKLNSAEVTADWTDKIKAQVSRFVDFDCGANSAVVVNNLDWTADLDVLTFLRDYGKHFSVNAMIQKESVRQRIERDGEGISFTEFTYILLQSLDFAVLNRDLDCTLQIGGSDQWGNITSGIDLTRRLNRKQVYGLTLPLVTKADGTKFGKTEDGTVWLDAEKTSHYAFYQFWINVDDSDLEKLYKLFTFMELDEISAIIEEHNKTPHLRMAQKKLAWDLTCRVHGEDAAKRVRDASAVLFGETDIREASAELLDTLSAEIPFAKAGSEIGGPITDLLVLSGGCASKGEAKRKIKEGGVYLNGSKVTEETRQLSSEDLLDGGYVQLRVGKKDFRLVKFGD